MTLPTPNLDDRTFDDIVEEAIRLIPQYCPEWTNYNPSDPGITLVELFAWMTEMILYRLNKVPDKVYVIPIHNRPFFPAQVLPVIVNEEPWAEPLDRVSKTDHHSLALF